MGITILIYDLHNIMFTITKIHMYHKGRIYNYIAYMNW